MSIFDDNIHSDLSAIAYITAAVQDVVNMVADKVNNHFGDCRINPETFGVNPISTFDTFWYELGLEITSLRLGDKYKKCDGWCVTPKRKNIDKITYYDDTTEFEFHVLVNFIEPSDDIMKICINEDIEIPVHAKINNYPNWP